MRHRAARFFQKAYATQNLPEIRWADVTRIEAMGTDAFSAFQVWLTFTYADGTRTQVTVEMKGYWISLIHCTSVSLPFLPTGTIAWPRRRGIPRPYCLHDMCMSSNGQRQPTLGGRLSACWAWLARRGRALR